MARQPNAPRRGVNDPNAIVTAPAPASLTGRPDEARLVQEPGAGTFCHGGTPGMADICLASIVVVTRVFGITVPAIPTIDRIMASCEALPAFADADPRRQVGAPA